MSESSVPFPDLDPHDYALTFAPVPVRARRDGWTPDRQRRFILVLRLSGDVANAARAAGCTPQSAYRLRKHAGAAEFALAWDRALDEGRARLFDRTFAAALAGRFHVRRYRGRFVGLSHRADDLAMMAALRAIAPHRPSSEVYE